ncbi:MAG: SEC-C metal-binding domain-containing protein, partial [Ignavibacteriales bacterium]
MSDIRRDSGDSPIPWEGFGERIRLRTPRPGSLAIRHVEESMSDIDRLVSGKSFDSLDEMNKYLQSLVRAGRPAPKTPASTPLQAAQDMIYRTVGLSSKKRKLELARKALNTSPDCADAYVILADAERDPAARLRLFEEGVAAGERALKQAGTDLDKPEKGEMWSIGSRPYMRARLGLAHCLWDMGRKDDAVGHYRDLLRLNPDDNQGVRQVLLNALLDLGRIGEARALLKDYPDDASADWYYARAFILWTESGDCRQARMEMRKAFYANAFVPEFLIGRHKMPSAVPADVGLGDEDEAVAYAFASRGYWTARPGALAWMDEVVREFTAGLPFPRGLNTVDGRRAIQRAWRALKSGKPANTPLMRAISQHRDLGPLWMLGPDLASGRIPGPFVVGGIDVFGHLHLHRCLGEVMERRDDSTGRALAEAGNALIRAGVREHEAMHLLIEVYLAQLEVCLKTEGWAPFNAEAFIAKLNYLTAVASGAATLRSRDGRPERNETCPCGSGAKFKKCCGRDDGWPMEPVARLTREVQRRGKASPPGSLGLMMLLGEGKYVNPRSVERLHEDHPLVRLENLSAVAKGLNALGHGYTAWLLLETAIGIAGGAPGADSAAMGGFVADSARPGAAAAESAALAPGSGVLRVVLEEAVELTRKAFACEKEFEKCARMLAEVSHDPNQVSLLWSEIAGLRWDDGDARAAEEAFQKALAVEHPHPATVLDWGHFLSDCGRFEEGATAYSSLIDSIQRGPSVVGAGADPSIRDILAEALERLAEVEH